jgi:iron complex outermembrane receptor protein
MMIRPLWSASLLALLPIAASAASAQEAPAPSATTGHDDAHPDDAPIIVTGHLPIDFNVLSASTEIGGDDLVRQTRGQIGETLAHLPGVSATSFAPGASRPVLRGFDGDRIRVLVDGIGSVDASSVSVDHAVVFDPLTVDHIDVLHGPAALLFGGQAIGGAINAADKRIPRMVPENGVSAQAIAGYGSAADERSVGGAVDVALAPRLVAHIDANWRKSGDLRVGGYVNSEALRGELAEQAAGLRAEGDGDAADQLTELAGLRGRIPNTAAESTTFGAGLAFIDQGGNIGVSVQRYDTRYGIPARPGPDAEDNVSIDLGQTRLDLRAAVDLGGIFDSLHLRAAYGDYRHVELEGDEIGTTFIGKGVEGRLDLVQKDNGGWRGRSGVQVLSRKLDIIGDEAFTPANQIDRIGLFTLQSLRIGSLEAEAAGRYEHAGVKAQSIGFDRSFDLWSGALGLAWLPADGLKIGATYSRGARAPSPEELLSDGVHIATQSYELGNPGFGIERSEGVEGYVRFERDAFCVSLTGYLTDFKDFISAVPDGAIEDGFPVYAYSQGNARFRGFEAEASARVAQWGDAELRLDGSADYVRADLKGIGPVPRIPPLRIQGGIEYGTPALRLRAEVEWNDRQNRVAALENPVDSFTLANLSADWHPLGSDGPLTIIASANNLFNVNGRRAASLTRDFVPIAGRDLRVSAIVRF